MKKIVTIIIAVVLTVNVFAQAPQKMSYQAVIRNSSSVLITSTTVGMQISILQGSSTGTPVYVETQTPTSNANGLVSIEIGGGTIVTGNFATINWASGPYFIKTETDPLGGTAYTISGTSELLSVPYALHAKTAESITGGITETDPVFTGSPANGISTSDITNWNNKLDTEVDGSITNEIQALSISNDTVYLSNGGFVKLPAGFNGDYNSLINKPSNVSTFTNDAGYLTSFTEVDGSVTNEIQALSISNDTVYLSNGGFVKLPAGFDGQYSSLIGAPTNVSAFTNDAGYLTSFTEVDGSVTNELQALSISNDTIYLSNGGFVKLPSSNAWSLIGNAGTVNGTNFIGTTDNVPLSFKVNNQKAGRIDHLIYNTFFGYQAGNFTTAGNNNTASGYRALYLNATGNNNTAHGSGALFSNIGFNNTANGMNALYFNTSGAANTGNGVMALFSNVTGNNNTANGYQALYLNTAGSNNTANGMGALYNNTGNDNTASGYRALYLNTIGADNTANGYQAGYSNTTGNNNTASGYRALYLNTTGANNTANGMGALYSNIGANNTAIGMNALYLNGSGNENTAIGKASLFSNISGNYNTAVGMNSLYDNTNGMHNSALGISALENNTSGGYNTALGSYSYRYNTAGNYNTIIGSQAGENNTVGSSNVFIGYAAGYNETGSNKLYIANHPTNTPLIYGDFSTGKVGIGNNSPSARLHIGNGTRFAAAADASIFLQSGNGAGSARDWKIYVPMTGGYLAFRDMGLDNLNNGMATDAMAIQWGTGNVGIGTTNPAQALDVVGNINSSANITSPKFNVTQVWNSNAGLPPASSFTSGGGTLIVMMTGSGYSASVSLIGMNLIVDGINVGTAKVYTNEINSHKSFSGNFIILTGITAGSHTIQLTAIPPTTFDAVNDIFSTSILELPF